MKAHANKLVPGLIAVMARTAPEGGDFVFDTPAPRWREDSSKEPVSVLVCGLMKHTRVECAHIFVCACPTFVLRVAACVCPLLVFAFPREVLSQRGNQSSHDAQKGNLAHVKAASPPAGERVTSLASNFTRIRRLCGMFTCPGNDDRADAGQLGVGAQPGHGRFQRPQPHAEPGVLAGAVPILAFVFAHFPSAQRMGKFLFQFAPCLSFTGGSDVLYFAVMSVTALGQDD